MIQEIAPGVFTSDQRVAEGKNGIVFGNARALAIDTGNDVDEGLVMATFIRDRGRAPDRVAVTHGHGDHVLGLPAFPGAEIFAPAGSEAVIRRQVPGWAKRWQKAPEEVERSLVWPTVTFSHELTVDLGARSVHFFPTPGHSADSICAYIEAERILFGGDTVVTGIVPAFGDGDSAQLERSLRRLHALEISLLVPGHGPVLVGAGLVRDWLGWMAGYISGVREHVARELAGGHPVEAIVEALPFDPFIQGRISPEKHGMPERHRNTARKLIAELQAQGGPQSSARSPARGDTIQTA